MQSGRGGKAAALIACGLLTASGCTPSRDWHAELAQAVDERDRQMAELDAWRTREAAACESAPDPAACSRKVLDQYLERMKSIWHNHLAKTNRIFRGEPAEGPTSEVPDVR